MRGIKLLKIFGIQVSLDLTWFVVFSLVVWSLAAGYFPLHYPGKGGLIYLMMGIISSLLLFASVLFHEISHSIVSNKLGTPIKEITLFIFGGVAKLSKEPEEPMAEFKIAIAGPISSIFLVFVFYILKWILQIIITAPLITAILDYLVMINIILVVFNLIPGFPLDGGRVLRAILWQKTNDVQKATAITSSIGKGFAMLLIFFGIIQVFAGNFLGGMWSVFIGLFLQQAAESGYQQALIRNTLAGVNVRDAMTKDVVTIPDNYTISRVAEEFFFVHHFIGFPVISDGKLVGMLTLNDVRQIPKSEWDSIFARDVMDSAVGETVISPADSVMDAMTKMINLGRGRLPVVEDNRLVGIITRRDIMKLMEFRIDLGMKPA
ncbi:MAG: site-2 protease family protein [Deltaproteobacteria bacterium]|nr:site-2 protease family protein [Deltaproteobacteria bacterium]